MNQGLFWIAQLMFWAGGARAEIVLTPPKVYSSTVYTGKGSTEIILPSNARPEKSPGDKVRPEKTPAAKVQRSKNPPVRTIAKKGFTDTIDSAIFMHRADFKACYEKQAKANPGLQGQVVVQFAISEFGKVIHSAVKSSSLNHTQVERCLLDAIAAIQEYPRPGNGITLQATYPFNFVQRVSSQN